MLVDYFLNSKLHLLEFRRPDLFPEFFPKYWHLLFYFILNRTIVHLIEFYSESVHNAITKVTTFFVYYRIANIFQPNYVWTRINVCRVIFKKKLSFNTFQHGGRSRTHMDRDLLQYVYKAISNYCVKENSTMSDFSF